MFLAIVSEKAKWANYAIVTNGMCRPNKDIRKNIHVHNRISLDYIMEIDDDKVPIEMKGETISVVFHDFILHHYIITKTFKNIVYFVLDKEEFIEDWANANYPLEWNTPNLKEGVLSDMALKELERIRPFIKNRKGYEYIVENLKKIE